MQQANFFNPKRRQLTVRVCFPPARYRLSVYRFDRHARKLQARSAAALHNRVHRLINDVRDVKVAQHCWRWEVLEMSLALNSHHVDGTCFSNSCTKAQSNEKWTLPSRPKLMEHQRCHPLTSSQQCECEPMPKMSQATKHPLESRSAHLLSNSRETQWPTQDAAALHDIGGTFPFKCKQRCFKKNFHKWRGYVPLMGYLSCPKAIYLLIYIFFFSSSSRNTNDWHSDGR